MKEKYKYVKEIISDELINFFSSWSITTEDYDGDAQVPMSHGVHSKD